MRVGVIVQARVSSTRLPGKVLMDLPPGSQVPMLAHVVRRLKRCKYVNRVIVATTTNPADDPVAALARIECSCFRGSEDDVLARYFVAAHAADLDVVVRVTSDCPFIDPVIVDAAVTKHLWHGKCYDYTSNTLERTFARGMDVEVFSIDALDAAFKKASKPYQREHVTPYLYENPTLFTLQNITAAEVYISSKYTRPDLRLTVDTPEDYDLAARIYTALYMKDRGRSVPFSYIDVVHLLHDNPGLVRINAGVMQKPTVPEASP